ncbi:hypothetical protein CYY_003365 [Polysphondylium violaceum]|uniref:PX domain-containing protein n=1 Tax=Polysphondylium violaceum TaxID=133409 RepID=A0A8J4PX46_9MYCE|nr:hypothetical protein CYY_003365 [Polysphondylium violaceum]
MSEYNSKLLFGTEVTFQDSDSTFESFSNDSSNPFNEPVQQQPAPVQQQQAPAPQQQQQQQQYNSDPVVVVQQKINPPSPHNSVNYSNNSNSSNNISYPNPNGVSSNNNSNRATQNYSSSFQPTFQPTFQAPSSTYIGNSRTNMDISVTDPVIIGEGIGAYVVYKVNSKTQLRDQPDYVKDKTVTRRYSDFLWLRNSLKDTKRGIIIPPLPEKAVLSNRNKEFLEGRRRELEKFLNRIAENEGLVHANEVGIFLEGTDEQLSDAKRSKGDSHNLDQSTVSPPQPESKGIGKITSLFGSGINSISNLAASGVHSVKEIDDWFGYKKIYILQLDSSLRRLEESVSIVIKKRRELSNALGDFCTAGLSFSSCEAPQRHDVASGFQRLTEVEANIRKGMDELNNNEAGYFEEGIKDYIRVLSAVKELLNDRLDALLSMQNQERLVASKKEKFEKVKMSNKADAMRREVDDACRKLNDLKVEYDNLSACAKIELTKFDEKRAYEMKRILNFVIRLNLDHFLKSSDCWKEFLTEQHQNGDPNFDTHNKASWGSTTI